MASEVGIVNAALSKLGVAALTALTDDSPAGVLANREYTNGRDDMLREHNWNWATRRIALAASATAPIWEFENAFPIPSDFMRLVEVNNPSKLAYRIESTTDGTVIVTDIAAPLQIAYVYGVTDPNNMDPKFREALSARYAMEWSEALTGSKSLADSLEKRAVRKLRDAKGVEGQEDSVRGYDVFTWTDARR